MLLVPEITLSNTQEKEAKGKLLKKGKGKKRRIQKGGKTKGFREEKKEKQRKRVCGHKRKQYTSTVSS